VIEVWHAQQPTWGFNDPEWPTAYTKVAEVETDDLDRAYELTNHIDRAWFTNPGVRAFDAPRLRSTSVGDVLVRAGAAYRCADAGWTLIPAAPAPEVGVVVLEQRAAGRICTFASTPMPHDDATELAAMFTGSEIVDVDTLREWKRAMVNGGGAHR